jgi:hypothetical protein
MRIFRNKDFRWRIVLVLCVIANIYFVGFFFAFRRTSHMYMPDPNWDPKGPKGVSLMYPRGGGRTRELIYYLYYPMRKVLRAKGWAWFILDPESTFEELEESSETCSGQPWIEPGHLARVEE